MAAKRVKAVNHLRIDGLNYINRIRLVSSKTGLLATRRTRSSDETPCTQRASRFSSGTTVRSGSLCDEADRRAEFVLQPETPARLS
jgi:hypothetical protein